ncbi:MAG: cyclopropane-fatty-acyl-phospholipid synthase family protein [Acidimicrobiales bacterium]|jgi:cyclopropane-fatty-acyl-phospholipid synthase
MITDKSSTPRPGGADQLRPLASQPLQASPGRRSAAAALSPLVRNLLGDRTPVRFELWDGSSIGPEDGAGTIHVRSADALRRILWVPGELGVGRAYVAGDIEVEGDIVAMLASLHEVARRDLRTGLRALPAAFSAAYHAGAIGLPLAPPPEEARVAGFRHSRRRDVQAVTHHYDVGNEFYELVLGPSMTYSCARFADPEMSLEQAQESKHDLICRKLGLREGKPLRLLDVGCGWGSMAMHAAASCNATVVGITLSEEQAGHARKRVAEAGLGDRVEIRVQDYRDLRGERFDAISSIGMFEHVGKVRTGEYFETLRGLLEPGGRLLNHAISEQGGSKLGSWSFFGRYVFPDGELIDVGDVVLAMERAGFECRDVESLREHYALTLRCWVANLEANWEAAVKQVGLARARIWRLYMAGSVIGFESAGISVHQVLGVVPEDGRSGMPRTRSAWG